MRKKPTRIPRHIGLIPDGNRRWADARGLGRHEGYAAGIEPGIALIEACRSLGIREVSIYGFTKENVRRPAEQVDAFRDACVGFAERISRSDAALRVVGDTRSRSFPAELKRFETRSAGDMRVNLLANYSWKWDLQGSERNGHAPKSGARAFASADLPRIDLVVRWGGRRRLSGFLPIQSAYADIFMLDTLWPDMQAEELLRALEWYADQDVTMGG
jgi:undecaprenyl diphosphate synthase